MRLLGDFLSPYLTLGNTELYCNYRTAKPETKVTSKNKYLHQQIGAMFARRHSEGLEVFGERGMVSHWGWHRQVRQDIKMAIRAIRGVREATPPTGWASAEDFRRDNPESVW